MKRIGILSDTHGTFDDRLAGFFRDCDELWHAGDFGNLATADAIAAFKPLRGVYGNIDDHRVRLVYPEFNCFEFEGIKVLMTHIGGYPKHYDFKALQRIEAIHPDIFISGHSHILKVMPDRERGLLHINPGAAGKQGFHYVRTAVRIEIDKGKIENLEVGEWER